MACHRCGYKNDIDDTLCGICGQKLRGYQSKDENRKSNPTHGSSPRGTVAPADTVTYVPAPSGPGTDRMGGTPMRMGMRMEMGVGGDTVGDMRELTRTDSEGKEVQG